MNVNFEDYKRKVLSQFGQDGVIEKIFDLIRPLNKFFVEFGSDGTDEGQGNTAYMRRYGFDGLLMDGAEFPYGLEITKRYPVEVEFITVENIIDLFKKYNVPNDLDFLSIDIDGNDYWVLKEILTEYRPQVICVEINHYLPPNRSIVQRYNPDFVWKGDTKFGASKKAFYDLGIKNGYSLVSICDCDMIFIRNESIPEDLIIENINNPDEFKTMEIPDGVMIASLSYMLCWSEWIDLDNEK